MNPAPTLANARGIAAMQPFDVAVRHPWSLAAFLGTGAAAFILALMA